MASFQSLMDVEESEVCDPMPRQDNNTGGCIKTRDYLSDEENLNGGKENLPPMMTPSPSKRRRVGPLEDCKIEIREAKTPVLLNFKQLEEDVDLVKQAVTKGPLPSSEAVQEAQAVFISPPVQPDYKLLMFPELQACSSTDSHQDAVFELQSPRRPPSDDLAAASPAKPACPFLIPSLLEMKPTGEDCSSVTPTIKKKQVRFGGPLSPELFDKNLPPSTPLQKGATPSRAPTDGCLKLRSLLKTPQRSESQSSQAQLDFGSPSVFSASHTFAIPRNWRTQCVGGDNEEMDGKIVFPSMDEIDSAGATDTEHLCKAQLLNLDTAFHKESLCEDLTESVTKLSMTSQMDTPDEPIFLPEEEEKQLKADIESPAPSRSSNRRKKAEPKSKSATETPPRSSTRKRKEPEETELVRRSTRSAAKSASEKMKMTPTATCRFSKEVNRSLYSSREYASKTPTLSPVIERLSFISVSPEAQLTAATSCTTSNQEPHMTNEMGESINGPVTEVAYDTQEMSDIVTNNSTTASEASVSSTKTSEKSSRGKRRGLSGPKVRGLKKRKVSVSDDDVLKEDPQDQTDEHCEDKTTANLEESTETSLKQTVADQEGADTEELCAQTYGDTPHTGSGGKSEYHDSLDAPTSACPPLCDESNSASAPTEPAQNTVKQKRGRPRSRSVLPEQRNHTEEHRTSHDAQAKGEEAASQQENNNGSSTNSQGEWEVANLALAPWQTDFNFEDVFKPVTTRGQRSVRRSLRNNSSAENSTGLAWLPQTPSKSITKARSRRQCSALHVQPSLPEETQHNAS